MKEGIYLGKGHVSLSAARAGRLQPCRDLQRGLEAVCGENQGGGFPVMAIGRRGFCRRVTSRSYLSKPAAAELLLVVLAPSSHCVKNGPECLSQVGERVLHPWGHLCERFTMNEPRFLHGS